MKKPEVEYRQQSQLQSLPAYIFQRLAFSLAFLRAGFSEFLIVTQAAVLNNKTSGNNNPSSALNNHSSVLNNDSSALNNHSSVLNNDSSVLYNDSSVLNNDFSVLNNDSSVFNNDSSVLNNDFLVLNNDPTVLNNKPVRHKKSSSGRKSVVKKKELPEIFTDAYNTADDYLHYSNSIIFSLTNSPTAINLILLAACQYNLIYFMLLQNSGFVISRALYPEFRENVKIFEGVIERYCGTPP